MARRSHAAAATRILVGGFAVASTLGILTALAADAPDFGSTSPAPPVVQPVATTTPPTLVQQVYRYIPVPAGVGGTSGGSGSGATRSSSGGGGAVAPSSGSAPAAAAPAPAAAAPATATRGS